MVTCIAYHIRLMFHGRFSFAYFVSRWPFAKLKTAKIRFSTSGNEADIPVCENKKHEYFVKPTFACFRKVKYPRNRRRIRTVYLFPYNFPHSLAMG